jgi:phosphatidylcholine synthase
MDRSDRAATGTRPSRAARLRAWAVHAFTASGAVFGFLALATALDGDRAAAFLWLGVALAVDGVDGALARKADVRRVIPGFDGAALDNVIDYFTYVAVPAVMIYRFGMVPPGWEAPAAAAIMAVSGYTFANLELKTRDWWFTGFPATWNLVALAFHVLGTGPWINLAVIAVCGAATFAPLKFVHPVRVRAWRPATLAATAVWAAASLALLLADPAGGPLREAAPRAFWAWCATTAYFLVLTAARSLLGPPPDA